MKGLHILGRVITSGGFQAKGGEYYLAQIVKILQDVGLTPVGTPSLYEFGEGAGFTAAVTLQESHVAIHTWPELEFVDLDIYACGVTRDNSEATRQAFLRIADLFDPVRIDNRHDIAR